MRLGMFVFETAYLGLGSNLGDKKAFLDGAVEALNASEHIELEIVSDYVVTKAVTSINQPDFLNAACRIKTILTPYELLTFLQDVEKRYGRTGKGQYDPRTLDIDILFYGDHIISEDDLMIPHPLLHLRGFVLHPLMNIAPDVIHPSLQESVKELYYTYIQAHGHSL